MIILSSFTLIERHILNVAGICTAFFLLSSIAHPKVYSLPRSRIANILKFLSENPVAIARGEGSSI